LILGQLTNQEVSNGDRGEQSLVLTLTTINERHFNELLTRPSLTLSSQQESSALNRLVNLEGRSRKMQIVRATGPLRGFKVIEFELLLPELVDMGERREEANSRFRTGALAHWVFCYVVDGTSRVGVEGRTEVVLRPGSIACLPPNFSHWGQYGPEPKHHLLWVSFHLNRIESRHPEWKLSQALHRVHFAHDLGHLEHHFRQLIREATTPSIHQASGVRLAVDSLVLEVVRGLTEPKKILSLVSVHPAISRALTILETRFRRNWSVDELAEEVGLSRSRLAELFNLEVGSSVHRFLNKVRVRHAEKLLGHSELAVGEIASECGFATIQHFSRVFKEVNGQSPVIFRRRRDHPTFGQPRLLSSAV
jgi:AraC-like DNA-binding protein